MFIFPHFYILKMFSTALISLKTAVVYYCFLFNHFVLDPGALLKFLFMSLVSAVRMINLNLDLMWFLFAFSFLMLSLFEPGWYFHVLGKVLPITFSNVIFCPIFSLLFIMYSNNHLHTLFNFCSAYYSQTACHLILFCFHSLINIYLFSLGWAGSSLLCAGFSSCSRQELLFVVFVNYLMFQFELSSVLMIFSLLTPKRFKWLL